MVNLEPLRGLFYTVNLHFRISELERQPSGFAGSAFCAVDRSTSEAWPPFAMLKTIP